MRLPVLVGALIFGVAALSIVARTTVSAGDPGKQKVGQKHGSQTLVATGQEVENPPQTLTYGARPIDMVLSKDGRFAYVKDTSGLTVVDLDGLKIVSQSPIKNGVSLYGIALTKDGKTLAVSDAKDTVDLFSVDGGEVKASGGVSFPAPKVGGAPYPCGLAFSADGTKLYVAINRSNAVGAIDVAGRTVSATYPVDIAPVGIALRDANRLLVTCWAASVHGIAPSADSSGTAVAVDRRGIGTGGTLCALDLTTGTVTRRLDIGLQATEIALKDAHAYVAVANSDQIEDVDLDAWTAKPAAALATLRAGSEPSSLTISGDTLYAACGGRNTVLKKQIDSDDIQETQTPWYPIAVRMSRDRVVVASNEGLGMRIRAGKHEGWNSYDFEGSITVLGPGTVWTDLAPDPAESQPPSADAAPAPVPLNIGEQSAIDHVVYILKENRTYDQVLGDMPEGDSDPSLAIYGKNITPNQHALADQFVLLDNYYCNGVLSADGHAWAMEGNATSYFQRSFGGWTRSYPYGDDPLSVTRSGFIWDDVMDHGKSFKNYGEFDYATAKPNLSYKEILQDFEGGANTVKFVQNIGVARLRAVSQVGYPGWNLGIPDVLRAHVFIQDLVRMERDKAMPNFVIVYLPQDHTSGGAAGAPTPRAQVADNDLAVGQVVQAISKSIFWPHTAIFVNEDDPQNGFDHVDGHRSMCLVVSPYSRRHTVVSNFYNQTSVLRTIEHMLGIPPMNRMDASSPLMTDCFQPQPDMTPYRAVLNQVPLDEMSAGSQSLALRLDKPDQVDDDLMNRLLWKSARGAAPYPAGLSGPHGSGLASRGLKLAPSGVKDSD